MPNPIVHWELNAEDAGKAQDFFAKPLLKGGAPR